MKQQFAIVTGSTKGIGREIACLLLDKGYSVIFNYAHDTDTALQLENELKEHYEGNYYFIQQRLENEDDINTFYKKCISITQTVDVLVLNAGCTDRTPWKELTWQQWQKVMNVNLNAPAAIVRAFNNHIVPMGNIVFIGAVLGVYTHAISIPYSVSKAGVHALTKALVKEYCETGIRVNAVLPGFVDTPWQKDKPIAQKERICAKLSLHRFATASEIADIVWSVITSTYMNGALIEADGGYCYQ